MRSPYNPSAEDLRLWAYDAESFEPKQDWDLVLSWTPYDDLFMEFASDLKCPKTDYFLALLYFIVGDAVRKNCQTETKHDIEALLQKAEKHFPNHRIYLWVRRSRDLLAHPDTFRYGDWCAGILARKEEA
jgi:hypothetical protein